MPSAKKLPAGFVPGRKCEARILLPPTPCFPHYPGSKNPRGGASPEAFWWSLGFLVIRSVCPLGSFAYAGGGMTVIKGLRKAGALLRHVLTPPA